MTLEKVREVRLNPAAAIGFPSAILRGYPAFRLRREPRTLLHETHFDSHSPVWAKTSCETVSAIVEAAGNDR